MPPPTLSSSTSSERWRDFALLALATLVCLGPFLDKAYCIDDPLFLWAGRHIQSHPFDFFGFPVNWNSRVEPMHAVTMNPPLACYYVAVAAALVGWSEPALHAAFLIPAFGVVWGTWRLARSMCRQPLGAALIALFSPVFLVSSTNVMCDTLALCCWVWAIVFWIRGLDSNRARWLLLADLCIAASALTKYFGLCLIPLLAVYTVIRQPRAAWKIVFLVIPISVLENYQWATWLQYGHGLLLEAVGFATLIRSERSLSMWRQTLIVMSFLGGCFLPILFYLPWTVSRRTLVMGAVGVAIFTTMLVHDLPWPLNGYKFSMIDNWRLACQVSLFAGLGTLIVWLTVTEARTHRNADSALLVLWVLGTIAFAGYVNWTCNGRSLLPLTPALGILVMRNIELRAGDTSPGGRRWMWSLIPALGTALLFAWADYCHADAARTAANQIAGMTRPRERPVWFQGHWGFQYYMEQHGAQAVDRTGVVFNAEDTMVIPHNTVDHKLTIKRKQRRVETVSVPIFPWLTTWNIEAGAAFYGSFYGPLPFVFGPSLPEVYEITFPREE